MRQAARHHTIAITESGAEILTVRKHVQQP
jgi:methionine aminopeptidase